MALAINRAALGGALTLLALFASTPAIADKPTAVARTLLAKMDYPEGYTTSVLRIEIPANVQIPVHQHPGIESVYVLEGGGTSLIEGQPDEEVKPGMTTIVPPKTPHGFKNGPHKTVVVSTFVVEKGKPVMEVLKK
ncbi:cupin domain-containing protein [Pseudomonas matsuisoli]|uniref:Cupin n=1 Tax=Pseudomonas matsuisoli TaxID=1515666 RepID=A0A917Q1R2_9PSED|nr:cupin domain-containing protein [Pseudomonas matsuisoli]GGK06375.1 cupin [Pseudomonas matsuisoli]